MNNPVAMRRYAAEISGVDDGVGKVLDEVRQLGMDEQTLIVFTADQGLGCGQHGLWGMGDHTKPLHAFDPTMHIPLIFRHQGTISAGSSTKMMVANYDMMPTILGYLGMDDKKPTEPSSPGQDFSRKLRGQSIKWNNAMFYEYINTRAIRTDQWKLILRHDTGPNELYNLSEDPEEWINLYDNEPYADIQFKLSAQLTEFFDRYADPRYDLWNGGSSKTLLDLVAVKKPDRSK